MKYKTKQNSEEHTFSLFKGDSSVFSQRVSAHTYHIFIDDYIGPPCQYRECVETLMNAESHDMVVIHINSDGGELASALEIINAMGMCEAPVQAVIHSKCASAATLIALHADSVIVSEFAEFVVHTATWGVYDFTSRAEDAAIASSRYIRKVNDRLYEDFLTPSELEQMHQGKEFFMDNEEVERRLTEREERRKIKEEAILAENSKLTKNPSKRGK